MSILTTRRRLIAGLGSSALLAGCDSWSRSDSVKSILSSAEGLNMTAQRALAGREGLAREFTLADVSPIHRMNGDRTADTPEYQRMLANGFADYRLRIDGLVDRPLAISLDQLRGLPSRTQITRHDCVEGWSAIGQWTGVPLSRLLDLARLRDSARYLVFHCADSFGSTPYYESIDLVDAFHPQTILAWAMNGRLLPVGHGAPLRLRLERQLGYKMAKYIRAIEITDTLAPYGQGGGGYWEDRGYEWYAGI